MSKSDDAKTDRVTSQRDDPIFLRGQIAGLEREIERLRRHDRAMRSTLEAVIMLGDTWSSGRAHATLEDVRNDRAS